MRLIHWKHPKTGQVRLYVPVEKVPELSDQCGQIKVWFEACSNGQHPWLILAKGVDASHTQKVETAVFRSLGISSLTPWSELEERALPANATRALTKSDNPVVSEIARIRISQPLMVSVGKREPKELATLLMEHPSLVVLKSVSLPVGSVRMVDSEGAQLLMWRVPCDMNCKNRLEQGIRQRWWFEEADKLRDAMSSCDKQSMAVILLEGDPYEPGTGLSRPQIDGALAYCLGAQRVSLVRTEDLAHTASFMVRLAGQFSRALEAPADVHRAKPKVLADHQRYILESLPGVSEVLAEALLARFGDVASVMAAPEAQLMEVHGLGRAKARQIRRVLTSG